MFCTGPSDDVIALVDCNSFYASCEKVFRPRLDGKPVVVLSNNDGCVVACSAEAKLLKIKIGTPFFECEQLVRKHGGAVFSSNYTLYGDMSRRVMETLSGFSPDIEIYSIDEAFLSLRGLQCDLAGYGDTIRSTVRQWTGIPVSVGIGPSKTLAKIANHLAKNYPSAGGVFNLKDHPGIDSILKSIPVNDIWGIGDQYAGKLHANGITSAFGLKYVDDRWIRKNMTITGLRTVMELRGKSCISLENAPSPKKGIASTRSFGKPVESLEELKDALALYVSTAGAKLRAQRSAAARISVFIMTDRFGSGPQYYNSCTVKLPVATSYTPDLVKYSHEALEKIFRPGHLFKKAGVFLEEIVPEDDIQYNLFLPCDNARKTALMKTMDLINGKFGSNTLRVSSISTDPLWKMRRNRLSPRYTTRWDELLVVG